MKVIRISDIVHEQLKREAKAEGRTLQWVVENKLTAETPPSPKNTGLETLQVGTIPKPEEAEYHPETPRTDDLVQKNNSEANASGVSRDDVLEQPCCGNEVRPCKHWVWDTNGEGYRNSLSGRFIEVEG